MILLRSIKRTSYKKSKYVYETVWAFEKLPEKNLSVFYILKDTENNESGYQTEMQPVGHNYCKETSDKCYTLLLPVEEKSEFFLCYYGILKNSQVAVDEDRKGDVLLVIFTRST